MHTDDSYRQLVAKAIAFFEEKGLKKTVEDRTGFDRVWLEQVDPLKGECYAGKRTMANVILPIGH